MVKQDFSTAWLWIYNNERPNVGIGGIPPTHKRIMAA
jgi:putative transposase